MWGSVPFAAHPTFHVATAETFGSSGCGYSFTFESAARCKRNLVKWVLSVVCERILNTALVGCIDEGDCFRFERWTDQLADLFFF